MNYREIRLSIILGFFILIDIISIYFFRIAGFFNDGNSGPSIWKGALMLFIVVCPIYCFVKGIQHLVKAFKYKEILHKDTHYIEWIYDENSWNQFILRDFKCNLIYDFHSFVQFGKRFLSVTLIATILVMITSPKYRDHIVVYFAIPFTIYFLYIICSLIKNIFTLVDHIFFSNHTVILTCDGLFINGKHYNWGITGNKKLIEKKIIKNTIELEYGVPSRISDRHVTLIDLKKLVIPIPNKKNKEAEGWVNSFKIDECNFSHH